MHVGVKHVSHWDAGDRPAKLLARATLIGKVEEVDEATAADAAQRHLKLHPFGVGVDEPRDSDLYLRLNAETCFYVGGMGGNSQVGPVWIQCRCCDLHCHLL